MKEIQEQESCSCQEKHAGTMNKARREMPDVEELYDLSELFKVFGDTTRIRILWALSEGEMCVCDIAELLEMGQSAISHQLRLLRQARLVRCRREGKSSVYALDDDHVKKIFDMGLSHIEESRDGAWRPRD